MALAPPAPGPEGQGLLPHGAGTQTDLQVSRSAHAGPAPVRGAAGAVPPGGPVPGPAEAHGDRGGCAASGLPRPGAGYAGVLPRRAVVEPGGRPQCSGPWTGRAFRWGQGAVARRAAANSSYAYSSNRTNRTSVSGGAADSRTARTAIRAASSMGQP